MHKPCNILLVRPHLTTPSLSKDTGAREKTNSSQDGSRPLLKETVILQNHQARGKEEVGGNIKGGSCTTGVPQGYERLATVGPIERELAEMEGRDEGKCGHSMQRCMM